MPNFQTTKTNSCLLFRNNNHTKKTTIVDTDPNLILEKCTNQKILHRFVLIFSENGIVQLDIKPVTQYSKPEALDLIHFISFLLFFQINHIIKIKIVNILLRLRSNKPLSLKLYTKINTQKKNEKEMWHTFARKLRRRQRKCREEDYPCRGERLPKPLLMDAKRVSWERRGERMLMWEWGVGLNKSPVNAMQIYPTSYKCNSFYKPLFSHFYFYFIFIFCILDLTVMSRWTHFLYLNIYWIGVSPKICIEFPA